MTDLRTQLKLFAYLYIIMLTILFFLVFILSMALAALGISLTIRLRNTHKSETFGFLLYFQIFIYTFGFYGIWGQVLINAFLLPNIPGGIHPGFPNIPLLMGIPFLIFAWLMLIQFSSSAAGRQKVKYFIPGFLVLNFALLFLLGYYVAGTDSPGTEPLIRNYFIVMNVAYALLVSAVISIPSGNSILTRKKDIRSLVLILPLITVIQCLPLLFHETEPLTGLIFIFIFFLGNIFIPVFLSYAALLPSVPGQTAGDLSFRDFCVKYEISPRESDVIKEICKGLSNKEISNKLFISLQTVKDHTHRIYIKTNVRSRVQLINLVKGESASYFSSAPDRGRPGIKNS